MGQMSRKSVINGTKSIRFRVSDKMYEIIKEASIEMGTTISDVCRSAINTYFMSIIIGKQKDIEKEFMEYARKNKAVN